jgi:hypothetical protein
VYEFIRDYDDENPHNRKANLDGIHRNIYLVLDGQQRITAMNIGLRGSYRYFYYRWRTEKLYLNLFKEPDHSEDDPEALKYEFQFRESELPDYNENQLWYKVGRILNFEDAEDAKIDMKDMLTTATEENSNNAMRLIGRLHNRLHTTLVGNYYEEKSQDYGKVLQVFIRSNSAGQPLEYSDLLLSTATAEWSRLDAREEINRLTDSINEIGSGYDFGKDFVLKSSLYLTESLPIQYKVKNFTKDNLLKIETNWDSICTYLRVTVRLVSKFGFSKRDIVSKLSLLPVALYLMRREDAKFDTSTEKSAVSSQVAIKNWMIISNLKKSFSGSSDTTLNRLREVILSCGCAIEFPADKLYISLGVKPNFSEPEIEQILSLKYNGQYTRLALSLIYPDRDWKGAIFHQDHIFPQRLFNLSKLKVEGVSHDEASKYMQLFNNLPNLELLTETENMQKNSTLFSEWIKTRDDDFRDRHLIPLYNDYSLENFNKFYEERKALIIKKLRQMF